MDREQFTFYESFFRAIRLIKKKSDRADAYDAICSYALYGLEPNLESIPDSAAMAYIFSKPILDASRRKAEAGKRGGGGRHTESKPEANWKQTGSKLEANRKQEKEQVKEQVKDQEQMLSPISPSKPTLEQVEEYARQRRSIIDPKRFFEHYDSAGWRDKNGAPIYSWQQKFLTWEANEQQRRAERDKREQERQAMKPGGSHFVPPAPAAPGEDFARMQKYLEQSRKAAEGENG